LKSDPKRRGYITLEEHVWKGFGFGLTCLTSIGIRQLCSKQGTSCWELCWAEEFLLEKRKLLITAKSFQPLSSGKKAVAKPQGLLSFHT